MNAKQSGPEGSGGRQRHDYEVPALLAGLHDDHANTAALLKLLRVEIAKIQAGESPDYQTLLDVMDYFTSYPDLYHHPNEELLFARLCHRDVAARAEVAVLSRQHDELARLGKSLLDTVGQVLNDLFVDRDAFYEQGLAYADLLRAHMLKEEDEIFPLALRVLSAREWLALDEEFAKRDDPLFGEIVAHRYGALAERLAEVRGGEPR